LKSGDLAVVGSDAFANYRAQLIDDAEYARTIEADGAMVGFPVTGQAFVDHYRTRLAALAMATDQAFPSNQAVTIVNIVGSNARNASNRNRGDPGDRPRCAALVAVRMITPNTLRFSCQQGALHRKAVKSL